jgi:hypothetical protein
VQQVRDSSAQTPQSGVSLTESGEMIVRVNAVQEIHYCGRLAAVVLGEAATIDASLSGHALLDVQAMCLYALEVATGERPGVYSDQAAVAFAAQARAQRAVARALGAGDG